jgi:ABC-2 type transport system ATP-binding protein
MIELMGLQKVIDQTLALDIPALTVAGGEIAAVVGPVGSGKGALLDLLTGKTRPTAGMVRLASVDPVTDREAFSRCVGVLFAEDSLYPHRSPRGNLDFYRRLRGLPKSRVSDVLTQVGLVDRADARLSDLPSGLQRRLAFGCATLHDPPVLLLVDPFARCDEASIGLLGHLVRQRRADDGAILVLADDAAHLRPLCDTIYTLERGRIGGVLTPEDAPQVELPFKIPVKLEDKVALVNPGDVLCAVAQEGRSYLQTKDGLLPTQFTLTELETRLARSGFFRAHRSYLVNLQHVKEVIPYTRSSFSLILNDAVATEIPLSKSAAAELRDLLDY